MAKNKSLKYINNQLENEVLELKIKIHQLEKGKETFEECKSCQVLRSENNKLKEEICKLSNLTFLTSLVEASVELKPRPVLSPDIL
jgi:cell division protein FtsB